MIILGVSGLYHDSAAVLIVDGVVKAAVQEERFSRVKHDESFPIESIKYCLNSNDYNINDIDAFAFYDKPLLKFERILETHLSVVPFGLVSFISSMPIWMKEKMFFKKLLKDKLKELGKINWKKTKLLFPEHHLSHSASAYYPSGYDKAAILTIDGVGEWATTSIAKGEGNKIKALKDIHFPHSLGLLYSAFTYYLGFKVNSGEYKLMGLAPYGRSESKDTIDFIKKIKEHLISLKEDGSYQLNLSFFKFTYSNRMSNDKKWYRLFGVKRRASESEIEQVHCDLALAIQKVTEEVVVGLAKQAKLLTGSENLCLAGGVALNCVANGVLQRAGEFKNIYIQPAAGDAGGALGAALAVNNLYFNNEFQPIKTVYLGTSYSNENIEEVLKRNKVQFAKSDNIFKAAALELANQNVLGWFQGEMEFGPRALGNRSILGDPRSKEMQRIINLKIKYREGFRPFAPSVLREDVSKYFELEGDSPYMLLVHDLLPSLSGSRKEGGVFEQLSGKDCAFPAITHVDNSARIQTVDKEDNPRYWNLINEFKALTGCSMVINTSFNVRGEPIVCSPQDALDCFLNTEMDVLVLGDYILHKKDQKQSVRKTKQFKLD